MIWGLFWVGFVIAIIGIYLICKGTKIVEEYHKPDWSKW
jgi:hypothetical protein